MGFCKFFRKIKVFGKTLYWWTENAKNQKNFSQYLKKSKLHKKSPNWCSENTKTLKTPCPVTTYNPLPDQLKPPLLAKAVGGL
jgi:hypothetical protein